MVMRIYPGRHRRPKPSRRQLWLQVAGAALLAGSACIHLYLYLTGYRSIPSIGWLFLVQFVVAFVLAAGSGPDTSTESKCTGSCAAYWPPVTGSPTAGPGVTGTLGTITRPGGTLQATYDGHPLYTYIGDSGPGQASGNNLDLNGGPWYEVRVAG
jgi:Secreted repeat of unknown function